MEGPGKINSEYMRFTSQNGPHLTLSNNHCQLQSPTITGSGFNLPLKSSPQSMNSSIQSNVYSNDPINHTPWGCDDPLMYQNNFDQTYGELQVAQSSVEHFTPHYSTYSGPPQNWSRSQSWTVQSSLNSSSSYDDQSRSSAGPSPNFLHSFSVPGPEGCKPVPTIGTESISDILNIQTNEQYRKDKDCWLTDKCNLSDSTGSSILGQTPPQLSPGEKYSLSIAFLPSQQAAKKDYSQFSKCAQILHLPNRPPVVYVEKGRAIDISIRCGSQPPPNAFIQFTTYSLAGGVKTPAIGAKFQNDQSEITNLCFVQKANSNEERSFYSELPGGFLALSYPMEKQEDIIRLSFPFLNFKCPSTTKRDVRLLIALITADGDRLTETEFQLVSCSSPYRDATRHEEKMTGKPSPPKRRKIMDSKDAEKPLMINVDGQAQYMIMTEDYEVWKILNTLKKQLNPLLKGKESSADCYSESPVIQLQTNAIDGTYIDAKQNQVNGLLSYPRGKY